jgi:two-component system sensor kinase FixL
MAGAARRRVSDFGGARVCVRLFRTRVGRSPRSRLSLARDSIFGTLPIMETTGKMLGVATTSAPFFGADALRPTKPAFWVVATAYLIIYLALNMITTSHQFSKSGITLWSPDNGLSLLLIIDSFLFIPVVICGDVISDIFIHHVQNGISIIIGCETALSLGYFVVAIVLRDIFKFSFREIRFDNILALLATLPAAAAFTMTLYCGILYLSGAIPINLVSVAAYQFWLGDTVGMLVVIPAAIAIFDVINFARWRTVIELKDYVLFSCLIISLCVFAFASASKLENHQLFYLLFLPIIWSGIKYGYVGTALALLATHIFVITALTYYNVNDSQFVVFQILMFILSATGLLLGVAMTEREQAERMLRDQRAELARAAAGAMAATVAHEISQPLSAMSAFVHSARLILDAGQMTPSIAEARAALAEAEAQGQRTRAIIQRVRDFVAGGKLALESLDLMQLVQKISKLSEEEAEDRGVALRTEAVALIPHVRADRIAVEQALNNLIRNAIESASERKDSLAGVVVRLSQSGDRVVLDVDDNGPGVAPEVAGTLFETFETTKLDGMGLGLPLALQIAHRHSGSLTWRALEPQGARFSIDLPIQGPE